jgi:hypothetical protein
MVRPLDQMENEVMKNTHHLPKNNPYEAFVSAREHNRLVGFISNLALFLASIVLAILGASLLGTGVVTLSVCLCVYLPAAIAMVYACTMAGYLISEASVPQMNGCLA